MFVILPAGIEFTVTKAEQILAEPACQARSIVSAWIHSE
jgi:hypothetical protein